MVLTYKALGNNGKLGNQMFQYALVRAVSIKNNYEMRIPIGNYDLLKLNVKKNFINGSEKTKTYQEKFFHFNKDVFSVTDNTDFFGYFQSYKYFDKYRKEIVADFSFADNVDKFCSTIIRNIKQVHDVVSIHVRHGDYFLYPNIHPLCSITYYNECIEYMKNYGDFGYIVFSDDIAWCKQNIKGTNIVYSEFNDNIIDLCLMGKCDHNIICNSSFSWWAAYLNQNVDKQVLYPSIWFGPKGPQDYYDMCPNKWRKINVKNI